MNFQGNRNLDNGGGTSLVEGNYCFVACMLKICHQLEPKWDTFETHKSSSNSTNNKIWQ